MLSKKINVQNQLLYQTKSFKEITLKDRSEKNI